MTEKKTKEQSTSPLRTPKPKNKLGLRVPQISMPHEDIIRADDKPQVKVSTTDFKEKSTLTSHTSQSRQTSVTSQSYKQPQQEIQEIAPTKNFQKVANSISKRAVPDGWFKGKSKQLYDALYSLTRGAITPVRKIRVQKTKLMKLAGIGSRITFDSNIQHLIAVGLVSEKVFAGEHEGNEFEVFLPEESTLTSQTSQSRLTSLTSPAQKLVRLVSLETSQTSQSHEPINTEGSGNPKTFFKTLEYIDDDAPIISVLEKLNEMARKLTGRDLTKKELEKLPDLAEILISETMIAAARTGSISAPISFLTENLRRRLYSKPRPSTKKESRPNHLDVGKGNEIKDHYVETHDDPYAHSVLLTAEQRENTLSILKEAKAADSMIYREFKTYGEIEYTAEDFKWLLEKLGHSTNE